MPPKRRPGHCLRFAGGQDGGLSLGRIDPTASRPTQPRPGPLPRRAPRRTDRVVVSGFWIRQVSNYYGAQKCELGAKLGPKRMSYRARATIICSRHYYLQRGYSGLLFSRLKRITIVIFCIDCSPTARLSISNRLSSLMYRAPGLNLFRIYCVCSYEGTHWTIIDIV